MSMAKFKKVSLKILATLSATAIALCLGFVVTRKVYERWYAPGLVKKYPHDGQIGLDVFVASLNVACISALLALVIGTIWIVTTTRRSRFGVSQSREVPIRQPCPKCGARAGRTCKNELGQVIRGVHSERWKVNQ
jgi:ABC-type Fe3+ transport system permease subunit